MICKVYWRSHYFKVTHLEHLMQDTRLKWWPPPSPSKPSPSYRRFMQHTPTKHHAPPPLSGLPQGVRLDRLGHTHHSRRPVTARTTSQSPSESQSGGGGRPRARHGRSQVVADEGGGVVRGHVVQAPRHTPCGERGGRGGKGGRGEECERERREERGIVCERGRVMRKKGERERV